MDLSAFIRPGWSAERQEWELLHAYADARGLEIFTTDDAWSEEDRTEFDALLRSLQQREAKS